MGIDELDQEKKTPRYQSYQPRWPTMSYSQQLMERTPQDFQLCSKSPSQPQHS